MKITYDPEVDAAYIYLTDRVKEPETVSVDDDINLDFDADNRLVGIEVLDASKRLHFDHLKPRVETAKRRPVSWHRLRHELLGRQHAGIPVETSPQRVKNWVKGVGVDHVILWSERSQPGTTRKITRKMLEDDNLEHHRKAHRSRIILALWEIGGYPQSL